jgi:peptidoglycan/LPS O-acetylase OafA/YrhL
VPEANGQWRSAHWEPIGYPHRFPPADAARLRDQLDTWRRKLIDLSKRNRLLWFSTSRSTIHPNRPSPDDVYAQVMGGGTWRFYSPQPPVPPQPDSRALPEPHPPPRVDELRDMRGMSGAIPPVADTRKGYWPALDGVRALSVLAVVAVHTGVRIGHAGAFGVEVFFVLSGFLITSLLLDEHGRRGTIDLGGFYVRRALRLFPALAVFLLVCTLLVLPADAPYRAQTLNAIPFAIFYSFNWVQALTHPPDGLVTHTWSLAVEEQFYLVWPFVLLTVLKLTGSVRGVLVTAAAGALISVLWTALLWNQTHDLARVLYGSDTALTPLMLGCAAAALHSLVGWTPRLQRAVRWLGGLGFLLMLAGLLKAFPPNVQFTGAQAFLELGTAVAVLGLVTAPVALVQRALTMTPLVLMGRISYGIYLWQGPVIMLLLAHTPLQSWALLGVGLTVTLAISAASYVVVERRFLELKNRLRRRGSRHREDRP